MDFFKVAQNMKALTNETIIEAQVRSLDENRVVKANQDQLIKGIKADGTEMPEYSNATIQIKREEGGFISPSGKIALIDKGDLYDAMKLKKDKDKADLFSTDSKYAELNRRYPRAFGLTEENEQKEIDQSNPKFIGLIDKIIFR